MINMPVKKAILPAMVTFLFGILAVLFFVVFGLVARA